MAVTFRDYYEVLGVPRTATAEEIKRAYRREARKHHPDLKPAAERERASQLFQQINEAYEVLSDPEKRRKYDALGEHWKSGMEFTPPPGAGARPGPGGDWADLEDLGEFSDFFASLFGGDPVRPRAGARRRRGGDVEAELPVSLELLLHGGKQRIALDDDQRIDVEIPAGARDGTRLRLAGRGGAGRHGGAAGDLYLRLRLRPHPRYRVAGDDLETTLALWPWQAVLGATVTIRTLDGTLALKVPPNTGVGQRLRLRGRGLPRADGTRGDLYQIVEVLTPEAPTEEELRLYRELQRASPAPPERAARD